MTFIPGSIYVPVQKRIYADDSLSHEGIMLYVGHVVSRADHRRITFIFVSNDRILRFSLFPLDDFRRFFKLIV